jgi:hypothetical protein
MTGINLNVVGDVVVFTDVKVPVNKRYGPYTGEKIDFNNIVTWTPHTCGRYNHWRYTINVGKRRSQKQNSVTIVGHPGFSQL